MAVGRGSVVTKNLGRVPDPFPRRDPVAAVEGGLAAARLALREIDFAAEMF